MASNDEPDIKATLGHLRAGIAATFANAVMTATIERLSFLAGAVILFLSFFQVSVKWFSIAPTSKGGALAAGISLMVAGALWGVVVAPRVLRRSSGEASDAISAAAKGGRAPEANDREFMFKVFDLAMPAAFVKRIKSDGTPSAGDAVDILHNSRYFRFQDSPGTKALPDSPRYAKIWMDHRAGDVLAEKCGRSIQVEYPGFAYENGELRPILTFKTKIDHGPNSYIVGWYVPIDLKGVRPDADRLQLAHEVDQVKFRVVLAEDKQKGMTAQLGAAVKDNLRG
jgi:hypothetical protein